MREFHTRRTGLASPGTRITLGVLTVALGVVGLMMTGSAGVSVGAGVLVVVSGVWAKNNPLVRLHGDHVELKLAMLAPRHLVLYADLDEVLEPAPGKAFLVTRGKKLRLPVKALAPGEARELVAKLRSKVRRAA